MAPTVSGWGVWFPHILAPLGQPEQERDDLPQFYCFISLGTLAYRKLFVEEGVDENGNTTYN